MDHVESIVGTSPERAEISLRLVGPNRRAQGALLLGWLVVNATLWWFAPFWVSFLVARAVEALVVVGLELGLLGRPVGRRIVLTETALRASFELLPWLTRTIVDCREIERFEPSGDGGVEARLRDGAYLPIPVGVLEWRDARELSTLLDAHLRSLRNEVAYR
jgi:hypothetical protein